MMFKDDYKNAVDGISPDGYIRQKVLKKIDERKSKKRPSGAVIVRAACAVAACAALVLSVWALKPDNINFISVPVKQQKIFTYGDIYNVVKQFKPKGDFWYGISGIFNGGIKKSDEENYAVPEGSTGTNAVDDGILDKGNDYSETTVQVEGVGESNIVKTDGRYIYSFSVNTGTVRIIKAGKNPEKLSSIKIRTDDFNPESEMYIYKDRLIILGYSNDFSNPKAIAVIYDVSKPERPEKLCECSQSGSYSGIWNNSRLIGDKLYLISNYNVNFEKLNKNKPETYIPSVNCGNYDGAVAPETVFMNEVCNNAEYTVISGFNITDGTLISTQSVLGGTYALYCSTDNIITASYSDNNKTAVTRFSIADGKIEYKAKGSIDGNLLNQFSIDEYKGNFRFVTTTYAAMEFLTDDTVSYQNDMHNSLIVLNGDLKQIGLIDNIAPDERVYSVRFMGDTAYFVTFRQVDPLFSVDLSNPDSPKIIGSLKIPGFSNYLFPYGEGKLFGIGQDADEQTGKTGGVKLSMFDISNPADVTESAKAILDSNYSDAFHNHKAVIVNKEKNIIAFSVYGNYGSEYKVFGFTDGKFTERALIRLNNVDSYIRGLYIGSEFYIVTENNLIVLDINTFSEITRIVL